MKARPILFSGPMVRALLAGTKMQTRRVVKRPKRTPLDYILNPSLIVEKAMTWWAHPDGLAVGYSQACPYGKPGDLLWVREAFSIGAIIEGRCSGNSFVHLRDGGQKYRDGTYYRPENYASGEFKSERLKWKPSIHMPRWASRLTLRITDVRVERLQDISEADAVAEGVTPIVGSGGPNYYSHDWQVGGVTACRNFPTAVECYGSLWETINGPGSWEANPWVWCVSFEVIKANVDVVLRGVK